MAGGRAGVAPRTGPLIGQDPQKLRAGRRRQAGAACTAPAARQSAGPAPGLDGSIRE